MTPREAETPPSSFAVQVAEAIRAIQKGKGMSGRKFSAHVGLSNNYYAERMRHEKSFTLSDVELICAKVGIEPGSFLAGIAMGNDNA